MKYSDNTIVQKFIEELIEAFKYENTYRDIEPKYKNLIFRFWLLDYGKI